MMPAASSLHALQFREVKPEDYEMLQSLLKDVPTQEGIPAYLFKYLERNVPKGGTDMPQLLMIWAVSPGTSSLLR
eukprot:5025238-Pyramimonas_sp.AAC.1